MGLQQKRQLVAKNLMREKETYNRFVHKMDCKNDENCAHHGLHFTCLLLVYLTVEVVLIVPMLSVFVNVEYKIYAWIFYRLQQ